METIILVDKSDKDVGFEEKFKCHEWPAKLHRAFSIFIFNSDGEMLLHRRSNTKRTWPGFWTNACCSHPAKGETLDVATQRRLKEELGFTCTLKEIFSLVYNAKYDEKYGEHEFDHVFVGFYDGPVEPNAEEVGEWRFMNIDELRADVKENPDKYSPWFKQCFERVIANVKK